MVTRVAGPLQRRREVTAAGAGIAAASNCRQSTAAPSLIDTSVATVAWAFHRSMAVK
jgi:hypothetical protein